jgi:hypothetical protein
MTKSKAQCADLAAQLQGELSKREREYKVLSDTNDELQKELAVSREAFETLLKQSGPQRLAELCDKLDAVKQERDENERRYLLYSRILELIGAHFPEPLVSQLPDLVKGLKGERDKFQADWVLAVENLRDARAQNDALTRQIAEAREAWRKLRLTISDDQGYVSNENFAECVACGVMDKTIAAIRHQEGCLSVDVRDMDEILPPPERRN